MAPQATLVVPTPTGRFTSFPTPAPAHHTPFIPVTLFIFLGLCFAYTFSYILYRIIMAHRREPKENIPDSPGRGVPQFMNGARLTLNLSQNHRPTSPVPSKSPDVPDEEKHLTDPSHSAHPEVPATSPADSSSSPFSISMPPFTLHPDQELGEGQLQAQCTTKAAPAPAPALAQRPFSQRIAAKVKFLSRDRAEAIALDPKLAPVQGPLRPLSMIPSPPRKQRMTLFGFGSRDTRRLDGDSETNVEAR